MSENLPDIDDLFRKALDDHEDMPSPNVWANIDKNLDKKKVFSISQKYKKLKWVAAALLIFSAGMAMYTVHVRLRNKELVKLNEINKKKALKGEMNQNAKSSAASNAVSMAPANKSMQQVTTDSSAPGGKISAQTPTVTAAIKKRDLNEANDRAEEVNKSVEENLEKNLSANTLRTVKANTRVPKLPQAPDVTKTEKENKRAGTENKEVATPDNEPSFEKSKKQVDVATVNDKAFLGATAMPVMPESSSISEINGTNNRQNTTVAKSKSVIKPFKGSRFSATVVYSKDFVSTSVSNDRYRFREEERNEIKNKERISSASSKGVLVGYNFSKKWNVQSGLMFSTITTDIQPKTIFARPDNRGNINYRINCSAGYSYVTLKTGNTPSAGDSVLAVSGKNTLQYVAVPVTLSYNLPIGKFSLHPGAGLTANFLTKGNLETVVATQAGNERHSPDRIEGLTSSYVNGSLSLAANYYLTKNVVFNFIPVVRFALSAINRDAPVKTYINSFGLAAGLTIAF